MQPLVSFIFQLICHTYNIPLHFEEMKFYTCFTHASHLHQWRWEPPNARYIGSKTRDREGAVALFIGDFH